MDADGWKTLREVAREKGVCHAGLRHRTRKWAKLGWACKIGGTWIVSAEAQARVGVNSKPSHGVGAARHSAPLPSTVEMVDVPLSVFEGLVKSLRALSDWEELEQNIRADEREKVLAAAKAKLRFFACLTPDEQRVVARLWGLRN